MGATFSEGIVPRSDRKVDPGRVLPPAAEGGRPMLLTGCGRGVAVVRSAAAYEAGEAEIIVRARQADGAGRLRLEAALTFPKKRVKCTPWVRQHQGQIGLAMSWPGR